MRKSTGPEFIRFFRPILQVLLESGGSGTASEIVDRSLEIAKVSEAEQEAVNKNVKKEARRDGVPPIELVDGDILVDMFEKLELGLIPKREFDIDEKFFDEYRK